MRSAAKMPRRKQSCHDDARLVSIICKGDADRKMGHLASMKIILTGSSGRIGRAIYGALVGQHEVVGVDARVFATTSVIGDCTHEALMRPLLEGVDAIIHTAGPHAPHVGEVPDDEFTRVNVEGTKALHQWAMAAGVSRFVYTSTTALYGDAIRPGECVWLDEDTQAQPKSIYHRSKLAAEEWLEEIATPQMPVCVLRMSRSFPEPAPLMASYRLHRGIDARDVGDGHRCALEANLPPFSRFILSAQTPFNRSDCEKLACDAASVIEGRVPELARAFEERGWTLPATIDRVQDASAAFEQLGWQSRWGWEEVLAQVERADLEILPAGVRPTPKSE